MKTITTLIVGAGVLALQGCADVTPTTEEEVVNNESAVAVGSANIAITSSSTNAYCATVSMTNGLTQPTSRWQVLLDLKSTRITSSNAATFSGTTGKITVSPINYNTNIAAGASYSFNFCGSRTNTDLPAIRAWNMEANAYATCPSNSGLNPTKAAIAVAMALELGRWDPLTDLRVGWVYSSRTELSSTGLARCTNGCPNTKALLGQQDTAILSFVDQNVYNPTVLQTDLRAAWDRQTNLIANLRMNTPSALPPAHKLTLVAGPTNLGIGACGPHYIFQVDHTDGTPLSSTEANAVANALCYFGQGSCGGNSYLGFVQVTAGCPSGRTCVAIDPTDGDNSSTSTTTAGSAPTYPMNRVYDPANTLLGTQCITTKGLLGTLVSKCSTAPSTCGTLYCIPI